MKFQRFDLQNDADLMSSFVECYRQVFGAAPWNEWMKCHSCGHQWGIAETVTPDCCDTPDANEYWPLHEVAQDLSSQIARPKSAVWVAVDGNEVVGFCMGYSLPSAEFDEHLGLHGVSDAFARTHQVDDNVIYLDDIGVLLSRQGHSIGTRLLAYWLEDVLSSTHATYSILRTQTSPPTVAHAWYRRIGYREIAYYHDAKQRVVMAGLLSEVASHSPPLS